MDDISAGTSAAEQAVSPPTVTDTKAGPTAAAVAIGSTQGFFRIETADESGATVESGAPPKPDASNPKARELVFVLDPARQGSPPKEQIDLMVRIEQVLHAAGAVYQQGDKASESRFRLYYVSLFNAARWGLEGPVAATDQANSDVERIEKHLIDNAAGKIKNAHLKALSTLAFGFSIPCFGAYLALRLAAAGAFLAGLTKLQIDPTALSNFMLLWIGCFVGVCLSYGLRTTVFTLADLTITDKDYLRPGIRLIFAGTLTMLICLFATLGFVDIQFGTFALSQVADKPALAFVVGAICGISELALPASMSKKAEKLIAPAS